MTKTSGVPSASTIALAPLPNFGATNALAPLGDGRVLTKEEQLVVTDWRKQTLVIEATTRRDILGMSKIGDLHSHAAGKFAETVSSLLKVFN